MWPGGQCQQVMSETPETRLSTDRKRDVHVSLNSAAQHGTNQYAGLDALDQRTVQ
jgi:hypothetical protein